MSENRYAIIIGVGDYTSVGGATNLQYTVNDAARLYSIVTKLGGFDPINVHLFCDGTQATDNPHAAPHRSDILAAVSEICKKAGPDDVILFYFAGHGLELQNTPYLLTNDTRMNVVEQTALPVLTLNDMLVKSKAKCVFRVFDACRAAYGGERFLTAQMSGTLERALLSIVQGWATFSVCSSGEFAREDPDLKQGVFSFFLCEGLQGGAANSDGIVTLDRLIDFVKASVAAYCTKQGIHQTPHSQVDLTGIFRLTQTEAPHEPAAAVEGRLSSFANALDQHLSRVAPDVQSMRFTDPQEFAKFRELVVGAFSTILGGSIHAALKPRIRDIASWNDAGDARTHLQSLIERESLHTELAEKPVVCMAVIDSSSLVVPTTSLSLAMARFSFCYGLYYYQECSVPQLHNRWIPNPRIQRGRLIFQPTAAITSEKVFAGTSEIISRATESIMIWTRQLNDFIEERMGPIRKIGDVIS